MTESFTVSGEKRVRMPGKFFVLPAMAAFAFIFISMSMLQKAAYFKNMPTTQIETVRVGNIQYVPLPEFLVDLSPDRSGRTTYLKLSASIELHSDAKKSALTDISNRTPYIIERTTFFLRELRPEDFQGSSRMDSVKNELRRRVNLALESEIAADIVINDLVIQ